MPTLLPLSRKAWGDLEALHVVGYFAPEVSEAYVDLGLHPRAVLLRRPAPPRSARPGRA